ncbi:chorismate-binding protein [Zhihengliuella halotolerans]|uniref:Anthranilate synthase component 1/para-aminobenzoate synthetase n=1 Tax=Zhihengliuella halotolerans TaxID=370736 RepID=A0A4V2GA06_9MICC|nr:chorismate-binding protein [Zhihengliuella halotolerans]RZU62426.1 anthranilate synthase component 1/para-aminobenzoate synthetase [Zhihengliuella halotolerans]
MPTTTARHPAHPRSPRSPRPVVIAVDGRSGAGKSTLALELVTRLRRHRPVTLFHLEDLYPGWDGLDDGVEAYASEVLPALAAGRDAVWRAWDWETGSTGPERVSRAAEIIVVEGVGVGARNARGLLDALIWVDEDDDVRRDRALARDGATYEPYWDAWAAQESRWLATEAAAGQAPAEAADVVVSRSGDGRAVDDALAALLHLPQLHDALAAEAAERSAHPVAVEEIHLGAGALDDGGLEPDLRVPAGAVVAAEVFGRLYPGVSPENGPDDDLAEHAILLEASNPGAEDPSGRNRYSILADASGAEHRQLAEHRLTDAGALTTVTTGRATARVPGPFFAWLDRAWETTAPALTGDGAASLVASGCDFRTGWLGWLGYELKRESGGSTLPSTTPDAALFRADRAVVVDHHERRAWVITTARGDDADAAWSERAREALRVSAGVVPLTPTLETTPVFACRDSREQYLSKVRAAQAQITEGNSYEVCVTTALTTRLPAWDPWAAYLRMRVQSPAPFAVFARFGAVAIAGTSPERFLRMGADGWMRAEPIKGTRRRAADPTEDAGLKQNLAMSAKDRAENIMIVDLLRNDLVKNADPATLHVPRLCHIESYASVHQMVSTIDARLRPGASRAEALSAAFPPGSMTGAPKISTMAILDELEDRSPRGVYSGAIGYFADGGAADTSVVIRTLVMQYDDAGCTLTLGVGGAVTADSVPEEEWDEVRTKAFGVLSALDAEFPA